MSSTTDIQKTSINLTLEPEQKQLLEKAAALRCLTVSEYLLQLALDAATTEVSQEEEESLDLFGFLPKRIDPLEFQQALRAEWDD